MNLADIDGTWDYSSLPANVRVGSDCFLERKASFLRFRSTRDPGLVLGSGVRAYTWTEFNVETEGLVEVGDDSVLVGAVFMCAEHISIGKRAVISYHVTIADSDFHPRSVGARRLDAIANAPGGDRSARPRVEAKPVVIEDDVWIGIGAIILKGVRIGQGARIMAGTVVTRDVQPQATVGGNPAQEWTYRSMNSPNHLPHDWFPAPLPASVILGEGSWLYSSFAFLHCRSRRLHAVGIGKYSGIYNGSFFELGPDGEVSIGDYCTIVGATIATNGRVSIGDYCFIAHEVVIGDGPFASPACGAEADGSPAVAFENRIELGNDVWIGAGAIILSGARIGDGAVIGAAAVVDFEVPAYGIVGGNPGRILGFTID